MIAASADGPWCLCALITSWLTKKVLTADEGLAHQGIEPLVGDLNGLLGVLLGLSSVPLLLRMLHNLLRVLRVQGVHDVEEVRPVHGAAFG